MCFVLYSCTHTHVLCKRYKELSVAAVSKNAWSYRMVSVSD